MRGPLALCLLLAACAPYVPEPLAGPERQQALDEYTQSIAQVLAEKWNPKQAFLDYPYQALPPGRYTTEMLVIVDQQGDVVNMNVAKSVKEFVDREAMRAVHVAGPLPHPPEGLLYRSSRGLVAAIPLQFTINISGEGGAGKIKNSRPFELVQEL